MKSGRNLNKESLSEDENVQEEIVDPQEEIGELQEEIGDPQEEISDLQEKIGQEEVGNCSSQQCKAFTPLAKRKCKRTIKKHMRYGQH